MHLVDFSLIYHVTFSGSVEDLVNTENEMFDAVVASEVVEHVSDYVSFVEACCSLVKVNIRPNINLKFSHASCFYSECI